MRKYIAFFASLPESAKYVGNMKDPGRIMRISRVCSMIGYNFGRYMPGLAESHWSCNFRQKHRLVKQNPCHLAARHWFVQSERDLSQIYAFCCSTARFSGAIFAAALMRTKHWILFGQDAGLAGLCLGLQFWVGKSRHLATSMHFCNFRSDQRAKYR